MAEHKYSRNKNNSYHKNDRNERRHERPEKKHNKSKSSSTCYTDIGGSRTPPLPISLTTGTMRDLLKQRESIKSELKKITVHPVKEKPSTRTNNEYDKKRNSALQNPKTSKESQRKRKSGHDDRNTNSKRKVTESVNRKKAESSDENISVHSDEDEEDIIEQRRNKRKQLIEKLTNDKGKEIEPQTAIMTSHKMITDSNDKHKVDRESLKNHKQRVTDMFSESDDFKIPDTNNKELRNHHRDNNKALTDNWDDSDGYYNVKIGETINNNRYIVKRMLGQGVFANVLHAQDKSQNNSDIAIKVLRNNDLMYKTGLKEISFLKEINEADPDNKYHCIKFFANFMHRGHLCMVLESMCIDLRAVLKKYGKHHGINMKALVSYSRQLILALKLLKKLGIIHADIKPDNILVNEKKNVLKLCDFGSASKVEDNEPTPYLVSRFYRAPEIILGIPYDHGIDLWSTACTLYELATGKIMFTGNSNNKMIKCFMDIKGKIPNKLIRKGKFKDQHFNYNYNFLLHKKDEVTGRDKVVEITSIYAGRNLLNELKTAFKELPSSDERKIVHLRDLLDKMIMLDPCQRPTITECLKHPFIKDDMSNGGK